MSSKFLPNADLDFQTKARCIASEIGKDPALFGISRDDADTLTQAFERFKDALQASRRATRSAMTTLQKQEARGELEKIIRRLVNLIRANESIDPITKLRIGLRGRAERSKSKACPVEPPRLRFVKALHAGNAAASMHELRFSAISSFGKSKPEGAVRLELFVDLVPPDEAIPTYPGANHGGRPWYLRSFTRSPIVITPPMARVPMRVVYWARWADSTGNVGPFSATAAAWVEGGNVSRPALRIGGLNSKELPAPPIDGETKHRDSTYTVALIEAHYLSFNAHEVPTEQPKLEATVLVEKRQLEDKTGAEAA